MILDLLRTDNYASYNIKLSHILGLKESVYINQIINIMGKAIKKDKIIDDGFVKLDRTYIFNQTTINLEEQLKIDEQLLRIGLLVRNFDNPDLLKIDTEMLASITSCDDITKLEKLSKKVGKSTKINKETKDYYNIEKLKSYINCDNSSLVESLGGWIESIIKEKKSYLNFPIIQKFQKDLFNYSKGNLDVALDVVNLATLYGYRECSWAIALYEKNRINSKASSVKETASSERLSVQEY